jgi:hypothetical protein
MAKGWSCGVRNGWRGMAGGAKGCELRKGTGRHRGRRMRASRPRSQHPLRRTSLWGVRSPQRWQDRRTLVPMRPFLRSLATQRDLRRTLVRPRGGRRARGGEGG